MGKGHPSLLASAVAVKSPLPPMPSLAARTDEHDIISVLKKNAILVFQGKQFKF